MSYWFYCKCGHFRLEGFEEPIIRFFYPASKCPECGRKVKGKPEEPSTSPWEGVGGY